MKAGIQALSLRKQGTRYGFLLEFIPVKIGAGMTKNKMKKENIAIFIIHEWRTLSLTLERGDLFIEVAAHPMTLFRFDPRGLLFFANLHTRWAPRMKSTSGRWFDQIRDDALDHLSFPFPL